VGHAAAFDRTNAWATAADLASKALGARAGQSSSSSRIFPAPAAEAPGLSRIAPEEKFMLHPAKDDEPNINIVVSCTSGIKLVDDNSISWVFPGIEGMDSRLSPAENTQGERTD
jgi:hypothetical protein